MEDNAFDSLEGYLSDFMEESLTDLEESLTKEEESMTDIMEESLTDLEEFLAEEEESMRDIMEESLGRDEVSLSDTTEMMPSTVMKDAPKTADVLVIAMWLTWTCLSLTPGAIKNGMYDHFYPSFQVLKEFMLEAGLSFAPGLFDILQSEIPPTIGFFEKLPLLLQEKIFGVYLLVLEKDGHRPRIYVGSATESRRGFRSRYAHYTSSGNSTRPFHVQRSLDSGYTLCHIGLLCWAPMPAPAEIFKSRVLFFLLEAVFSFTLWSIRSRTKSYGMPLLCPWAIDTLEYDGCCSHSSLNEKPPGDYQMELTPEENAALAVVNSERRIEAKRDTLRRHGERVLSARIYSCDPCKVNFTTAARLEQHLVRQSHIDKVAGVYVSKHPASKARSDRSVSSRKHYCSACNLACASPSNLKVHIKTKKHLRNVAAMKPSDQERLRQTLQEGIKPIPRRKEVVKQPGIRDTHTRNLAARKYRCEACNYTAATMQRLNDHFRSKRHSARVTSLAKSSVSLD